MVLTTLKTDIIGCCTADITLINCTYPKVKLSVLIAAVSVGELSLFANIYIYVNPDSKPIATNSRRFSFSDKTFIAEEIIHIILL